MLEYHEQERRRGHQLPAQHEKYGVPGNQDQRHGGGKEVKGGPGQAQRLFTGVIFKVIHSVNRGEAGQDEHRHKKESGKGVKDESKRSQRHRPRQKKSFGAPREQDLYRGDYPGNGGRHGAVSAGVLGAGGVASQAQRKDGTGKENDKRKQN